jgi:hypothetical protein
MQPGHGGRVRTGQGPGTVTGGQPGHGGRVGGGGHPGNTVHPVAVGPAPNATVSAPPPLPWKTVSAPVPPLPWKTVSAPVPPLPWKTVSAPAPWSPRAPPGQRALGQPSAADGQRGVRGHCGGASVGGGHHGGTEVRHGGWPVRGHTGGYDGHAGVLQHWVCTCEKMTHGPAGVFPQRSVHCGEGQVVVFGWMHPPGVDAEGGGGQGGCLVAQ